MDTAKHGVIYFSMGSNLNSAGFPDSLKLDLLDMFASLPQTVIWKFEEEIPNLPINLHIVKWAPQQSVLGMIATPVINAHANYLSIKRSIINSSVSRENLMIFYDPDITPLIYV